MDICVTIPPATLYRAEIIDDAFDRGNRGHERFVMGRNFRSANRLSLIGAGEGRLQPVRRSDLPGVLRPWGRLNMEIHSIRLTVPENCNIIVGQSHFIKTVEDLYEILSTGCANARFGIAFCEASGPCLIRVEGNDEELKKTASENAMSMGAGHTFVIMLREAFPINVLNAVKACSEVCRIFCATANPLEVIVAETGQGRGVLGVVDGFSPKGVEKEADVKARREFLRKIGYKR